MSVVTKYGIRIPDVLMFVGVVIVAAVAIAQGGVSRYVTFSGLVVAALGYLWERFLVKPDATSQKG